MVVELPPLVDPASPPPQAASASNGAVARTVPVRLLGIETLWGAAGSTAGVPIGSSSIVACAVTVFTPCRYDRPGHCLVWVALLVAYPGITSEFSITFVYPAFMKTSLTRRLVFGVLATVFAGAFFGFAKPAAPLPIRLVLAGRGPVCPLGDDLYGCCHYGRDGLHATPEQQKGKCVGDHFTHVN